MLLVWRAHFDNHWRKRPLAFLTTEWNGDAIVAGRPVLDFDRLGRSTYYDGICNVLQSFKNMYIAVQTFLFHLRLYLGDGFIQMYINLHYSFS